MKVTFFTLVLTFPLFVFGGEEKQLIFNNGKTVTVEVAESMRDRETGLMNRLSLPKDRGMLFVFQYPHRLSFWMKDTYVDLSVGFFDKNKVLKEIQHMAGQKLMEKNQDLRGYKSSCDCLYALEVNKGWFKKNKVKLGAKFKLKTLKAKREQD